MEIQVSAFRVMLNNLAHQLSERDLQSMKYLCRDLIPRGRLESIEEPIELWDALEQREQLGVNNTRFLKQLLIYGTEGRRDLLSILQNYEASLTSNADVHERTSDVTPSHANFNGYRLSNPIRSQQQFPELRREVEFIVKNIGRDWRQFVRALGVCEADIDYVSEQYPRDLREKVRQTLIMWQAQNPEIASKEALITGLKLCERNDMVHQMLRGQY
ncbi:FAS-associated death domain protein-like [Liolophura sinensis]|uniref:FAS-associated death domain protein-like n=1 Tax=Liolophura sinensis TaxID=3198878 RepID=UPI003157F23E